MEKREKGNLYRELEEYREMGIPLYLNGRESTPGRIARAYRIAEEGDYMRDYIQDEGGRFKGWLLIMCVTIPLIIMYTEEKI